MKLSLKLPLVVGTAMAGIFVGTSSVNALDFTFQFSDGVGTVSGKIYGLVNDSTGPASKVEITSITGKDVGYNNTLSFPFNVTSSWVVSNNSFIVRDSSIVGGFFLAYDNPGTKDEGEFALGTGSPSYIDNYSLAGIFSDDPVAFSGVPTEEVPFDVPGGATIPTVGSLFALALMRKAKKRSF